MRIHFAHVFMLLGSCGLVAVACVPPPAPPLAPPPGSTSRVSVASTGTQANGLSGMSAISGDGRYVAFESVASNLVPGDTNDTFDVFVVDRLSSTTTRVSVASDGTQASGFSFIPAISADGRYVTYQSFATNLVPGDTNNSADVFVFDRQTNTTTRVSVASDGSQAGNSSEAPAISGDGRYVTYQSWASNLVPGDTNSGPDVFVFDRQSNTTTRVSVASDGTQANGMSGMSAISGDGRYVTYQSFASNLVPGDTNNRRDVFVFDRLTNTTALVSVASDGTQADQGASAPAISADGRYVAYESEASNLVPDDTNHLWNVFVFDRQSNTTTRVPVDREGTPSSDGFPPFSGSRNPAISADGRYVTYMSETYLGLLDFADPDFWSKVNYELAVVVFDRLTNTTTDPGSVFNDRNVSPRPPFYPAISADGRFIAYASPASNLVPGDTNNTWDVFVFDQEWDS